MKIGDPICGDYGPRFVGLGRKTLRQRWIEWRPTVAFGVLVFLVSSAIMALA